MPPIAGEPRTATSLTRWTPDELEALRSVADREGMTVAELIRGATIVALATSGYPFFVKLLARGVSGALAKFMRKAMDKAAAL